MSIVDALQTTLADEHAALYAYGVLGARTSQSASPDLYAALVTAYRQHRSRRDRLRVMVVDAGGTPVPAEPLYPLPGPLVRPGQLAATALGLEQSSSATMAALVAQTSGELRAWALTEAIWSATWELELGGLPQIWPGAVELG